MPRIDQRDFQKTLQRLRDNDDTLIQLELERQQLKQLTSEDILALADALKENKHLEALCVFHSEIGDEGVKAFAKLLETNNTLKFFSYCNSSVREWDECVQEIDNALKDNFCMESFSGMMLSNESQLIEERNSKLNRAIKSARRAISDSSGLFASTQNFLQHTTGITENDNTAPSVRITGLIKKVFKVIGIYNSGFRDLDAAITQLKEALILIQDKTSSNASIAKRKLQAAIDVCYISEIRLYDDMRVAEEVLKARMKAVSERNPSLDASQQDDLVQIVSDAFSKHIGEGDFEDRMAESEQQLYFTRVRMEDFSDAIMECGKADSEAFITTLVRCLDVDASLLKHIASEAPFNMFLGMASLQVDADINLDVPDKITQAQQLRTVLLIYLSNNSDILVAPPAPSNIVDPSSPLVSADTRLQTQEVAKLKDDLARFAKSANSDDIDTLINRVTTQLERQPVTTIAGAADPDCRSEGDVESSSEKVISTNEGDVEASSERVISAGDLLTLLQAINSFVSTETTPEQSTETTEVSSQEFN